MPSAVDQLDRLILKEYQRDARLSYREVAKRLGVATGTVLSRISRLEKEGIIKGYIALIDYSKLGYSLTAVTELTVAQGRLVDVEKEVAKIENTCCVYDVTGLTDAIVIAKFRDTNELGRFTKRLLSLPYVERTNTHVVLDTVKEDFRLPL